MQKIKSSDDFKREKKKKKLIILSLQIMIGLGFFLFWELFTTTGFINEFLVSKPSSIWQLFLVYIKQGTLYHHVWISTYETILGIIIGTVGGLLIAILLYFSKLCQNIFDPFLSILNSIPKTSLGPIIIIILGTSTKGIVGVSVSLSIVITIITSLNNFNNVDPSLVKMMNVYKANKYQMLTKLILPANINNLLSLIKVNIGLSWVGVIVGEFLVSKEGIGYLVVYGGQVFRLDLVMMGIMVLSFVSFIMYEVVTLVQFLLKKKFRFK